MGGGGGKGGGGQTSGSRALEDISRQLFSETTDLRGDVIGSLSDIVRGGRTGGIGANVPLVSAAREQTLQATSQALRSLEESPGFQQLAGTPFGERIRAETSLAGRTAVQRVPTDLATAFLPSAQNLVLGTGQTVVTGLGGATAGQSSLAGQRARAESDLLTGLFGLGAGAGAGAAAKGAKAAPVAAGATFGLACWIAEALYGVGSHRAELARLWIFHQWQGPWAAAVRWAYRRYGKWIAAQVDRRPRLASALLPWFDRAVENARRRIYEEWELTVRSK